eukprot:1145391-Pelagomonas_calceolata.AAC.4
MGGCSWGRPWACRSQQGQLGTSLGLQDAAEAQAHSWASPTQVGLATKGDTSGPGSCKWAWTLQGTAGSVYDVDTAPSSIIAGCSKMEGTREEPDWSSGHIDKKKEKEDRSGQCASVK